MKKFWLTTLFFIAITPFASASPSDPIPATKTEAGLSNTTLQKPKVIFFDVNETLLDLNAMNSSITVALGGRKDLMDLWFATMLHYSLVANDIGEYQDFGQIGVASLLMVAEGHKLKLTRDDAIKAIAPIKTLPPHKDVLPGLNALKKQGYKMVTLTNSSNAAVNAQLKNAGIDSLFDQSLSIEDIKVFKPHSKSYEWAMKKMGVRPEESLLVASHAWDIAGAKAAGMQTAFLARPGKTLYPLVKKPDYLSPDLLELSKELGKK